MLILLPCYHVFVPVHIYNIHSFTYFPYITPETYIIHSYVKWSQHVHWTFFLNYTNVYDVVLHSRSLAAESFPGYSCGHLSSRRRHTSSLTSIMALKRAPDQSVGLWFMSLNMHVHVIYYSLWLLHKDCALTFYPIEVYIVYDQVQWFYMFSIFSACETKLIDSDNSTG